MQLLPIGAILAPRVIASGRAWQRNTDVTLCIEDLPECAEPPYTLLCVTASGPADWEIIPGDRGRAIIRVTVPVLAQVRDNCCIVRTGHSSITVDVPVRMGNQSFGRHSHVTVIPWVSLACNPVSCDDACFDCSVEVLVDVYVTRWEAAFNGTTIPCRPDLPLNLPNNCCR